MPIEDRAARLAAELDSDASAVREDLETLISYRVPLEEAVRSLRRKHAGVAQRESDPVGVDIEHIDTTDETVSVTATVLSAGRRSIRYRGEEQVIVEGELADETGRINYTAWQAVEFEPGETITAEHVDVREWDGEPELNLGASAVVSRSNDSLSVPYDIGGTTDVGDVTAGDRDVTLEVEVLDVEERTIEGRDGETVVHSGVLGDATARRPFTDWEARDALREADTVRIENAYVREFRGIPAINLSEYSRVSPIDRDLTVAAAGRRTTIAGGIEAGGGYDIAVDATVVDVREGSGLIERCPTCRRVIRRGHCRSHGEVDAEEDLRVKAVLDDGTAAATAILGSAITATIYGGSVEAAVEAAKDAMNQDVIMARIRERLVGRHVRVRGQLSVDEYGANLEASTFSPIEDDPAERARDLLASMEVES